MQLLETGGKRLLQNSQLEAPSRNSCSGDGAAERDPKGRGGEFVPKKTGKSHNSPGICCSRCLREGRSCSRRILGAPKETTPFPASGMSQGEAGSAHPTGIPAGSSFDPGPAPAIPAAAFPPSQGSRGILPVFAPGMFPLDPPHPALFLPSFLPAFPRTLLPSSAAPSWVGLDRFSQILGSGGSCGAAQSSALYSQGSFPRLIPGAHSRGSFPELIPRAHSIPLAPSAALQCGSKPCHDASEQTDLPREFPPFSPSLRPHLGIPKAGSENPAGSVFNSC